MTAFERAWNAQFGVRRPGRIVCLGRNYAAHAAEEGVELPPEPLLFAKLSNTVVGPGEPIVLPAESSHVDAEAELALVIAKPARRVPPEGVAAVLAGYTAANDVSARDLQYRDGQWFRGKGFDTFCPIGTEVVRLDSLEPELAVRQLLNGTVLQDGNTRDFMFGVATVVAHVSNVLTLERGDVILTGTPDGVGYFRDPPVALTDGDVVEIAVEGAPPLTNPVVG
ncbi:MAG TPA: fumarylacetoacetate hydrolase family protein [Gaiellaceae bacterium]|nr:fumarylacetoacetate hydrolase family protein [Gaiellaceae bacterium]